MRTGTLRGFPHFVPAYRRQAMSLSAMRRDTPNAVSQFLVVRAIELLGDQGIEELLLNFAAVARWLHSAFGRIERLRIERLLTRPVRPANPYFQHRVPVPLQREVRPRRLPR